MECSDKNLIREYSMVLWPYSGSRVKAACDLQPKEEQNKKHIDKWKKTKKKLKKISSSLEQLVSVAMKFNIFQHETACYKCKTPCIMFRLFLVRPMKIQPTQRKIQLLIISFGLHYVVYLGILCPICVAFRHFKIESTKCKSNFHIENISRIGVAHDDALK